MVAHVLEAQNSTGFVEQTNDYLLTPHHWRDSNTEINCLIKNTDRELAVLRNTMLVNLEVR
jgi:hypothetical protein